MVTVRINDLLCVAGDAPDWHVAFVAIQKVSTTGAPVATRRVFPVHAWLRGAPGSSAANPVRLREGAPSDAEIDWTLEVSTGDQPSAGTDSDVYYAVEYAASGPGSGGAGRGGDTKRTAERPLLADPGSFSRGRAASWTVQLPDARPCVLHVRQDGGGEASAWYLERATLVPRGAAKHVAKVFFPCHAWLSVRRRVSTWTEFEPPQPLVIRLYHQMQVSCGLYVDTGSCAA